jgi:GT2 family glycosyltransferase
LSLLDRLALQDPGVPSLTPPASRNAQCPCGSGRRYKDCHGALAVQPSAAPDALPHLLHSALVAQQAGRLAEAIARYDQVLLDAPNQFDALHMQGVAHFQRGEFERALQLIERALVQRPGDASARFNRALVVNALARRPAEAELVREASAFARTMREAAHARDDRAVRVIAFYLPQFHRIPENDAWWGEGFTEWTNVRKAKPNFAGHEQPHRPGELGYYDLTDPNVREAQAQLARTHGVDAFCYYHYWFGGHRLLEQPLDAVLASGKPDFPFCVCWANENWTRRWDGLDHEILMQQRYSTDGERAFITSLLPLFRDRRYVRIDGRPLLLVYKIAELPDIAGTVALWRQVCVEAGVGDPYLAAVQRHVHDDPTRFGFDASVEFPPIGHAAESIVSELRDADPAFRGTAFGYANLAADYLLRPRPAFRTFRGVTPMWDNTARRQRDGMIVAGTSPELFGVWTAHALEQTRTWHEGESRLLFVNAWNEWAEGNHLEPDAVHGRRYLEALRTARGLASRARPARPRFADVERETREAVATGVIRVECVGAAAKNEGPRVSVVMPVYNHARYLQQALASLVAQTRLPDELVAIDDGSSDDSAALIASWARSAPFPVTLVRQANAGAHAALNRGMAIARGDVVALMNSDDAFAPERVARLVGALDVDHALAFSGVTLVDDENQPAVTAYAQELAARVAEVRGLPNLLYALVRHNAAVSTGNLVFRRALLDAVGGFAPLRVCHDWDFVLAATYASRIAVVAEPLYVYRLHGTNTFSGLTLAGRLESDLVLDGFFARLETHPWLDAAGRERLRGFAREIGLGGYL